VEIPSMPARQALNDTEFVDINKWHGDRLLEEF
jgi:hypothetical protein